MNTDWVAVKDPTSGKIYYANQQTRATQWNPPPGFVGNQQSQIEYNPQSQLNMHQSQQHDNNSFCNNQQFNNQQQPQQMAYSGGDASKWKKAYDPSTGREYWYNVDTKETTWDMPALLSQSVRNFDAAWGPDSDSDNDEDDDWDNDDDDECDSSTDDDLEVYDTAKYAQKILGKSLVEDGTTTDDDIDDEKVQNALHDDEEVLVDDTSNEYWNIGQSEAHKYPLSGYADKYFQKKKHGGMFKNAQVTELLKYAPYNKVKHALKKMDAKLDKQAQQIWKNINSYMGLRKSGKGSSGHIDKLLHFALRSPENLKDEIFCQICKQCNSNPSVDSLVKGWKLMAICCSVFPPSDEFARYLAVYLFNKTKESGVVGQYAIFSLKSLDRTMEIGQRRIQPMDMEIHRIEERQAISIKVYLLDGTFITLLVTSQTRTQQIIDTLSKALRLNHGKSFGLFEMEQPRPGWEKQVYLKRNVMEIQTKIDNLQFMPYDRELELNERMMDVYSSWNKSNKKKDRKIRFVFKCKLHSKAQENAYSNNEWKISFLTIVWNVVHGIYPLNEDDSYHLAALQLQAAHGIKDKSFYSNGIIQDIIDRYVPYTMLNNNNNNNNNNVSQIESKIFSKHGLYKHLSKQDAYRKYIEYLRKSNVSIYFDCSFFRCVRVTRLKRVKQNEIIDLLIGISENGVLFMHPTSSAIIERYKMEEILTYGFRANAFLFVAGTLMTQRRYQFATMLGKQMNDLLRAHIDLRVQQAEIQGYSIQH